MGLVFLTGFMGCGKSTVGRQLSHRLGYGFVDLDECVEARSGKSIAQIFDSQGEAAFRSMEAAIFAELCRGDRVVVATGGGTLLNPALMRLASRSGLVVALDVSFEECWRRIVSQTGRPLAVDEDSCRRLWESRQAGYSQSAVRVSGERPVAVLVDELESRFRQRGEAAPPSVSELEDGGSSLWVPLGSRGYPIELKVGGLDLVGSRLAEVLGRAGRIFVVSDHTVDALYGDRLRDSLTRSGFRPECLSVPPGEGSKSFSSAQSVLEWLMSHQGERKEPLIALGGGVVGDLVGFVASIYLRGVPFVQIPTTLLAQVDSSVGGKTAVNSAGGKNLVGSFYQPVYVHIDVDVLQTLEVRDYRAGLAEVLKYGLIGDSEFFEWLEQHAEALARRESKALEYVCLRSCWNKADVVAQDERETGLRAHLNFGHTLAHALETLGAYERWRHGEAVAIGMDFATWLSVRLGLAPQELLDRMRSLYATLGLPFLVEQGSGEGLIEADGCVRVMASDKKRSLGQIKYVLLTGLGRACLRSLSLAEIGEYLSAWLAGEPALS